MLWHAFLHIHTARTTVLPETLQFYWLHFCVQMCPFYPRLTPGTWCPHCLAAPLPCHIIPPCSYCTLVPMHCTHGFLQMVLTPSCGSFYVVWNTASCPGPRQSDSRSPHRTIWNNTFLLSVMHKDWHFSRKQQLNGTWREVWPSHSVCLKLIITALESTSKICCGGAIYTSGTHCT